MDNECVLTKLGCLSVSLGMSILVASHVTYELEIEFEFPFFHPIENFKKKAVNFPSSA